MDKKYRGTNKAKLSAKKRHKRFLDKHPEYNKQYYRLHRKRLLAAKKEYQHRNPDSEQQWYQKRKLMMHDLKINGCAVCGYNKCDAALDFHHVNPKDKEFPVNMHSIVHCNCEKFVLELNKCVLLCSNCHREIHQEERDAQK